MIAAQAAENGVVMEVIEHGKVPSVLADKEALHSIFTNLALNALQAMNGEGGKVVIRLAGEEAGRAIIEISDTGRGISPEDIAKVFEPYYSTKETGTGLGLAIVKKAVDDHGGSISVNSKEGSGTTFTISLPTKPEGGQQGLKVQDRR
jgi:signal transduction histidine kinase